MNAGTLQDAAAPFRLNAISLATLDNLPLTVALAIITAARIAALRNGGANG